MKEADMPLNESKGDMYAFVSHTFNTIKGRCYHDCSYCYMKQYGEQKPIRFDKKELKTDLGEGNFIFVGSSCDMWAEDVPEEWILETLDHCNRFDNKYLFQSKNPRRMLEFQSRRRPYIKPNSILGTTIESDKIYSEMGNAPTPEKRAFALNLLSQYFKTMVTIEPVMDFNPITLGNLIHLCHPEWVNIGGDSKGHKLPEPTADTIRMLIDNLESNGIEVKFKRNLKRLGV